MKRREFCKFLTGSAAAAATFPLGVGKAAPQSAAFGTPTQSYAELCATPELNRAFYALRGNEVVTERLDPAIWKEAGWNWRENKPLPQGWWNGVPMQAPIAGLAGQGPFQ